ncbi:MAG: DEAD/DEAH box helicase [bacterium]|nr:DEAD/DEAH box helicase [bacterium]
MPLDGWIGPDGDLGRYISEESRRSLNGYREQPTWVEEHASLEGDTARGGYQHRQLFELVQNGADALWTENEADSGERKAGVAGGRIEVRLTAEYLYCADDGDPIDQKGVRAIMSSHLSPKRGTNQIGTFGLGFKAVLGVSAAPEFFSRSGSFRFDQKRSREQIRTLVPAAEQCPALRLAEPIDPTGCWKRDAVLRDLMAWAVNVVRLPLRQGTRDGLRQQMEQFPAQFLLFVAHVGSLTLIDDSSAANRVLELQRVDDSYLLAEGNSTIEWRPFKRTHLLSDDARADRRTGDDRNEVPVWWAVPVDRLDQPGKFWAFFPTDTASLVPGILNAPWNTNGDRQNLLRGHYNDELIDAAAQLIADKLPGIRTAEDPARHLDVLPRRHESGDSPQADRLRTHLLAALGGRRVIPDQTGRLRDVVEISYPPGELTPGGTMVRAPFERWAAYPGRPGGWLHHKALTRTRLATIQRLFEARSRPPRWMRRASVAGWLEALVQNAATNDAVASSMAAIQTAARIPRNTRIDADLGRIVLTESGGWRKPDPQALYLPFDSPIAGSSADPDCTVHPELAANEETLAALKKLGLKPPSPEALFRAIANRVLARCGPADAELLQQFWKASRALKPDEAQAIIQEHGNWRDVPLVQTRADCWRPLGAVLMPGAIVPGDGGRDDGVTVDRAFHDPDHDLLATLGVVDQPHEGYDPRWGSIFDTYEGEQKEEYQNHCGRSYTSKPQIPKLDFMDYGEVGPLSVLCYLSEEGSAVYTYALLSLDACYLPWVMSHRTRDIYPAVEFESFPIWFLRKYGRVKTRSGIVLLADALGSQPASPAALDVLLRHPNADKIKEAFKLSDPAPEVFGEEDPIPLTDEWPGLQGYLPAHQRNAWLVWCERIRVAGRERPCASQLPYVYLARSVEDERENVLRVAEELDLRLRSDQIERIVERRTRAEIEERWAAVRQFQTDAERLLEAVGEQELRQGLPATLLDFLEVDRDDLMAIQVAEAAISTHHTGALREFRSALDRLDPPKKWAGSRRAVNFVRSLGFSDEWAGERIQPRPPFEKIEGPRSLGELHDYQKVVARNVRAMLAAQGVEGEVRRGMISLPTGSGKTRVAVQSIVEAMRDDGFRGGVLWIADRDELCEQAVVAWDEVWRSEGPEATQLRISRAWDRQPPPFPTGDNHVVVASIQTLKARLSHRRKEYGFLKDFKLVVFDEAHRSITSSATSVLSTIGLSHRPLEDEPFLIGLTATPYRKRDVPETRRLAGRYCRNRLDAGAFADDDPQEVIRELQTKRVLARVDHEVIEGGAFDLTEHELEQVLRFLPDAQMRKLLSAFLPSGVEDRIARSAERTRRILEAYEDHIGRDWPTLIFATSVEHAQTLAALLNRQGIVARAVSGETDAVTRRRVVEGFRRGEIKALVNYAVFVEGFDAPKTRAIIVARPVWSPNLYFQMIGRGLRGPRNGGDERCLILNVRDKIEGFGQALAFSDLDWLWDR